MAALPDDWHHRRLHDVLDILIGYGSSIPARRHRSRCALRHRLGLAIPCVLLRRTCDHAILTGTAMFKAARQNYQNCLHRVMTERICLYCGLNGDTWDEHIPSSTFRIVYRTARERHIDIRVPICRECKLLSGWRAFRTPEEKRRCIRTELQSKYGSVLNTAEWREDEVEELGYTLASAVKAGIESKQMLLRRLTWPRTRTRREL